MNPESGRREPPADGEARAARSTSERALGERYGPLALERRVKDDGRALVLYTHAEDDRE